MDYSTAMWALAQEFFHTSNSNHTGQTFSWKAARPATKDECRTKAEHTLRSWGYENKGGELVQLGLAVGFEEQATRQARQTYLETLIGRHPAHVAAEHRHMVSFKTATISVGKYAYEKTVKGTAPVWEALPKQTRDSYAELAQSLMQIRGFINVDGTLQFGETEDGVFRVITDLLNEENPLHAVEELTTKHLNVFRKTVVDRTEKVNETIAPFNLLFPNEQAKEASTYTNPFAGSQERRHDKIAESTPYPVNEDGAEQYATVTAPSSVVYRANYVIARDLYESEVPEGSKHWEDLHPDLQRTYLMQSGMMPLDLPKLSETFKKQWTKDVKDKRKQGDAPVLEEPELQGGSGCLTSKKEDEGQLYTQLAEVVCRAACLLDKGAPSWASLNLQEKEQCTKAVKIGWDKKEALILGHQDRSVYRLALQFRNAADELKLSLGQFIETVRFGMLYPGCTEDEAILLAFHGYNQSKRGNDPAWKFLSTQLRTAMTKAAYYYVTARKVDNSQDETFYKAIDNALERTQPLPKTLDEIYTEYRIAYGLNV